MKVYEAVVEVLRNENRPMEVREIYEKINELGLYEFRAKSPLSVVSKAIRQRSLGIAGSADKAFFEKTAGGAYKLT